MSITPEKLRACFQSATRNHTWAPIMVQDCPMLADAMEIADSSARSLIECECFAIRGNVDDGRQWDINSAHPDSAVAIEQALRYLDARGLLLRKDGQPHIVTIKDLE